jgi:hypothetical protein
MLSEQENTEMLKMLRLLCEKSGIQTEGHAPTKTLEQPTSVQEVVRQIDEAADSVKNGSSSG